jgi:hypothetical protein
VAARLRKNPLAGIDQDHGRIGGGGGGEHVARVLLVARSVRDDELAPGRREVAVRHVDGDPLFALGLEAIGEKRQVDAFVAVLCDARATAAS